MFASTDNIESQVAEQYKRRGTGGSISEFTEDEKAKDALALQNTLNSIGLETKE